MRKTTIFRSNRTALLSIGLAIGWAVGVAAQDTQQAVVQRPTVHTVQQGETLWGLAERYFADPFLWPEIYRLNTMVVEDPHWIFPGEELQLVFRERTEVEPEPMPVAMEPTTDTVQPEPEPGVPIVAVPTPLAPPPPPTESSPTVFQRRTGGGFLVSRTSSLAYQYRPVRRGEFYAAGFLTEKEDLPWASVLGAVGRPVLPTLPASSSARIFGAIEVKVPTGATYQVGDSLLVARLSREIRGWGDVVVPSGIARVTTVAGSSIRAEVIVQYGRVADGHVALPIEPFNDPGDITPIPVQNGAIGEIIAVRDLSQVPGQHDIVFIDLGRADGVVLGDLFEVLIRPEEGSPFVDAPPASVGLLQIVHVRDRSASGFVITVTDLGIRGGAPVRLVRKMPS